MLFKYNFYFMCYFNHFNLESKSFKQVIIKKEKNVLTNNIFYNFNVFFSNTFNKTKLVFHKTANDTRNTTICLLFSNYEPEKRANMLH